MTGKADFTEEEWKIVLEAPPSAGLMVIAADRGGSIRESFSMAKAYTEARKEHGESELLDEIASTKPEVDHTRYASPEELDEYRKFIVGLANRVAEARKEGFMGLSGDRVSDDEKAAIGEIESALA